MAYAIKAKIGDSRSRTFTFTAQKTMYGGKSIAEGDTIFVFASENERGQGLIARGVVAAAKAVAKKPDIERQTPRMSITVARTAFGRRAPGRRELKQFNDWKDGKPETELNFKFYGMRPTRSLVFRTKRRRFGRIFLALSSRNGISRS